MKNLYLISIGKLIRRYNNLYFVSKDNKKTVIPIETISDIFILNRVSLTYPAIKYILNKHILVHFFYENFKKGIFYYMGSLCPRQYSKNGKIIIKQVEAYKDINKRTEIALEIIDATKYNCIKVLEKYKIDEVKELRKYNIKREYFNKIEDIKNPINIILGLEANMWNIFYKGINKILKRYKFEKRSKRPPKNEINTIISFLNTLLYNITLSEIYKTHLEPTISFLHELKEKRFSLALDLSEPFKPIITFRILIWLINQGIIKDSHFIKGLEGVLLNEVGKRIILKELENRLSKTIKLKNKNKKSIRYLIRAQAYNLEKALLQESKFKAFRMMY